MKKKKVVFIQDQIGWNHLKCWNSEHWSIWGMDDL